MKKFFSFVAAVLFAGSMMADWSVIQFTADAAKGTLNDSVFAVNGFSLRLTDTDNKLQIDANPASFGSVESRDDYSYRLKTGGKSSSKNNLTLTLPEAGTVRIAVRTGSNADVTRTVVAVQGEDTLSNRVAQEADTIEGVTSPRIYYYHEFEAEAGVVYITYPVNGVNFYAFAFEAATVTPAVPQYEVAEAIAAGLADDTEILVRGVITKMEIKGKNFAKYGSVNIYVADATDAEGEFEFYNCYSLNADTFRTTTPAYDATSTAWAQLEEVVDGNGNTIHVGDTVIAFGKYKLFNTTHELNTGCYLVDVKHAPVAPVEGDTIVIDIESEVQYTDYVAQAGWWQFMAENDEYEISISNVSTTQAAGTYTIADLDADYTYLLHLADTTEIHFVAGSLVLTEGEDGSRTIEGVVTGDDDKIYSIKLVFRIPTPETTVNVEIPKWALVDASEYYGFAGYILAGETADKNIYLQITIRGYNPLGTFTYDDCYANATGIEVAGDHKGIYSMNFTVTLGGTAGAERAFVTADILCYNNTLYHVTTLVGEGINNVEAAVEAIKRIVNGQVVIEKAGKTYNVNGTVIR